MCFCFGKLNKDIILLLFGCACVLFLCASKEMHRESSTFALQTKKKNGAAFLVHIYIYIYREHHTLVSMYFMSVKICPSLISELFSPPKKKERKCSSLSWLGNTKRLQDSWSVFWEYIYNVRSTIYAVRRNRPLVWFCTLCAQNTIFTSQGFCLDYRVQKKIDPFASRT